MTLKKTLLLSSAAAVSLALIGCTHKAPAPAVSVVKKAPTKMERWRHELAKQDVQLIKQGWRLTLVLPADRLFQSGTTELKLSAYPLLERVAAMVDNYSHSTGRPFPIKVWGFADTVFNVSGQKLIGEQYAQSVGSFLWNSGFSHHELSIVSKGIKDPVAPQNTVLGRSFNRRVVIQVH